jgi:hypothetical protein
MWDIALQCICGRYTELPLLPLGRPLPRDQTLVLEPRVYNIRGPIDVPVGIMTAGRHAVERCDAHRRSILDFTLPPMPLTTESLLSLVAEVKYVLALPRPETVGLIV